MRAFTWLFLFLFLYIVAALLFWGFSLNKHSQNIYEHEYLILNVQIDSASNPQEYNAQLADITDKRERRTKQYLGEGGTFLLVILIGAAVVYSSFRRSIRLSRQQNNFMLSVTHELKSPIAAMKLNLQTLEKHKLDEAKQDRLINQCIKEANRLNDLCNNMLLASQMEGRQYRQATEQIDFSELLEQTLHEYLVRYPGRFEEDIKAGFILTGDRLLLHMAINNLLENAIKYTPADKPIEVKLFSKNNMALLQVIDQGHGIPDKEKPRIFNKFYRIGNEETRKTKGTGLGLYLTSKIVKQHKGKISVKDNQPAGAIFEMCFPLD